METGPAALDAFRRALSPAQVKDDTETLAAYASNVTALPRRIAAVAYPASTDEVARLVRAACEHRAPLWPVSTGKNWGLGSRAPVRDGATIVDLGRMDRIHALDAALGTATIEPGVTQGQLAAHLTAAKLPLYLNVTGSSPASSVIANALERGTGFHMPRAGMLAALQVVLGDGRVIDTGLARFGDPRVARAYADGIGPALDGLFSQSSFGIVTRATVRLTHRPPAHGVLAMSLQRERDLARFVDAVAGMHRRGVLTCALHFSSRARGTSVTGPLAYRHLVAQGCPPGPATAARARALVESRIRSPWGASCGLAGTKLQVHEGFRQARRQLRGIGSATLLTARSFAALARPPATAERTREERAWLAAVSASFDHSLGIPSDAALHSVPWSLPGPFVDEPELDRGRAGTFFVVPVIPLDGQAVVDAMALVDRVSKAHALAPATTWNQVSFGALEGVINAVFDREDRESCARARDWARALASALKDAGFPPYRLGVQDQDLARTPGAYDDVLAELGRVLDPAGVLAPGRYEP
jgi:4-cresol dehydrogenase (hydroxylating)